MKVQIKFDTERHPAGASIKVDGIEQLGVRGVSLDMDVKGIEDFRIKFQKGRKGCEGTYVCCLNGSRLTTPEGQ